MAGAGRRVFVAGEILTAAQVQDYLQDQAVMVFGGTAARGSAIASPSEGMFTFLTDTDTLEYYGGTAIGWVPFSAGATGGGTDQIFYENGTAVTTDYTITSGFNAMSAGPVTIDVGATVTVPSGSSWVVV
jgi:hypothetical protein